MKLLKKTFLLSLLVWNALNAISQRSYIYIELIKTIPCRIIQNGKEVAALSKNFAILTINENREQNIDVEFGAELYPKQSFVIDATADALFAYKLAKSGEKSFYLLDLVNNGKIIESNSAINIGLATELNTIHFGIHQKAPSAAASQKKGTVSWLRKRSKKEVEVKSVRKGSVAPNQAQRSSQTTKRNGEVEKGLQNTPPQYGVVEVINTKNQSAESAPLEQQSASEGNRTAPLVNSLPTAKSSCYLTASDKEIESFIEKTRLKSDDEAKLLLLRKKQFTGCLSVNQVMHIAEEFSTQYGKYNVVRISFSNIGNRQDVMSLESLFKTEGYRNKFYKLVNPQE